MRFLFAAFLLSIVPAVGLCAAEGESMAERTLRKIVERQNQLFAEAEKQGEKADEESFRAQAQSIAHEYDRLLATSQNYAPAYEFYGYFLGKVGMRKESVAMLLKANQLDPNVAAIKNRLGNLLAEDGKVVEAAQYFLAAIKLAPKDPLYHYQLGSILAEGRDTFLKSGQWTRAALDQAMHNAFKQAAELAPGRFEFAYRYAESFYDLQNPDWNEALQAWSALEEKAESPIERQTMRLHAANILIKTGKLDHAKALLDTVDDPKLQGQKERLLPLLRSTEKK